MTTETITGASASNQTQANSQDNNREMLPLLYGTEAVRIIKNDQGETWWVAKDVLDILELGHITNALKGLDDDELTVLKLQSGGQNREMKLINESGLYTLILRSNKPAAKPFRKWVTKDVLPQIRKTGGYGISGDASMLFQVFDKIDRLESKLDELRINSNVLGTVWSFAHEYCVTGVQHIAIKDDLYDAYLEYCRQGNGHPQCKSHFFMKLYRAVSNTYASTAMLYGKKTRVARGIGLKRNYQGLLEKKYLLEKGGD